MFYCKTRTAVSSSETTGRFAKTEVVSSVHLRCSPVFYSSWCDTWSDPSVVMGVSALIVGSYWEQKSYYIQNIYSRELSNSQISIHVYMYTSPLWTQEWIKKLSTLHFSLLFPFVRPHWKPINPESHLGHIQLSTLLLAQDLLMVWSSACWRCQPKRDVEPRENQGRNMREP